MFPLYCAGIVSYHGGKLDAGEAGEAGECTGVAALIHNGDDDGSITDEEIDAFKVGTNNFKIVSCVYHALVPV